MPGGENRRYAIVFVAWVNHRLPLIEGPSATDGRQTRQHSRKAFRSGRQQKRANKGSKTKEIGFKEQITSKTRPYLELNVIKVTFYLPQSGHNSSHNVVCCLLFDDFLFAS